MAALMRSVMHLLSIERNVLLRKGSKCTVESKRHVRGLRRKPVQVLFPESKTVDIDPEPPKLRKEPTSTCKAAETRSNFTRSPNTASSLSSVSEKVNITVKDRIGGLRFERASPGDKRLGRVVSVASSRQFRENQGKILLEGRRLICDALDAGANPQMVFFSKVERLCELPLEKLKRATLIKVKFEEIKTWSNLVAPQGVIAIFSRPDLSRLTFPQSGHGVPLSLICDNIRDPGNLGTILRSAAAAGCRDVLLTKGCVDAWEPKVLRAAMGAHFRLPVHTSLGWDDIEGHLPEAVAVHVAENDRGEVAEDDAPPDKPSKAGDHGWVSARRDGRRADREYDSDSDEEGLSLPRVDAQLYHERWARGPAALVIGGETHGLSVESLELAERTAGKRLRVPLVPGVDSLNAAVAASVILFEGRRQLLDLSEASKSKGTLRSERRLT